MTFTEFCESHGLVIDNLISNSTWQRVPTLDHPHKTNGAYIFDGNRGACQNWALSDRAYPYRDENAVASDYVKTRDLNKQVYQDKLILNQKAAKKAGWILSNSELIEHAYLIKKGFADLKGLVHENKLVVPMRVNGNLVGCQMIDNLGHKKFLYGQVCKGATYTIGQGKLNVLCEGYATGLSAHQALLLATMPCKVLVCFSANNMIEIAKTLKTGLVIADNDVSKTGLMAAEKIGWPYWISETTGNDFNDETPYKSYYKLSQELKKILINLCKSTHNA